MAEKKLRPCGNPRCTKLTRTGYCEEHTFRRTEDRPSAHDRGYNAKWRKARIGYLQSHPICVSCGRLATVVDHIQDHRGDAGLFWDTKNWQPLCEKCHNRKTASTSIGGWY